MIVPAPRAALLAAALLAVLLGGSADACAQDAQFLSTIEDLPLMPGLTEDADRSVVFDAPSGRIVESFATGAVDRDRVIDFYARTLPQLGWRADDGARFVREGEVLVLEFLGGGPALTVRFALAPLDAARRQ
jgi:hypothetical protein